jgi:hypothetical protein
MRNTVLVGLASVECVFYNTVLIPATTPMHVLAMFESGIIITFVALYDVTIELFTKNIGLKRLTITSV